MKLKINTRSIFVIIVSVSMFYISSCDRKDNGSPIPKVISADSARVIDRLKDEGSIKAQLSGEKIKFLEAGYFKDTSSQNYVAGTEYDKDKQWGIKFTFFEAKGSQDPVRIYSTPLLNGSFEEALVQKLKISPYTNEFVYYNSQDYFMGSGGGEIFAYIIDLKSQKVYYAHFFSTRSMPNSLYLAPDIDRKEVRSFFISNFRKDFPELKIANKDQNLENIF